MTQRGQLPGESEPADSSSARGRRPLGHLMAWLLEGHRFETKWEHRSQLVTGAIDGEGRLAGREYLMSLEGAEQLICFERPLGPTEVQEES